MKKALTILLALCAFAAAQGKPTIAIYPGKTALEQDEMEVLCVKILNALEKTERLQGIERSDEFLVAVNKEISTQRGNNFDDRDIAKISERFKADFVCAVAVRKVMGEYQVDARIIDVKTGSRVLIGEVVGEFSKAGHLQEFAEKVVKNMFDVSRQKLDEIFSEKKTGRSAAPTSGASGQPAAAPAEKRNEQSAVKGDASGAVKQPAAAPADKRDEQSATKGDKSSAVNEYFSQQYSVDMVSVKGGTFMMGCTAEQTNCGGDEKPVRSVTLDDFHIGKYPVTQKLWVQIMGNNPSKFKGDNFPVENVSFNMVQEFIEKLNAKTGKRYRLPTEAEWEYAARGGNKSKGYIYSGGNYTDDVAWHNGNSQGKTHAVGGKEPNELGVYDMSGNVWEWVHDWKDAWTGKYSSSNETNPKGPDKGVERVLRGGSWNYNAKDCRVSKRQNAEPGYRSSHVGFRLARSGT